MTEEEVGQLEKWATYADPEHEEYNNAVLKLIAAYRVVIAQLKREGSQ